MKKVVSLLLLTAVLALSLTCTVSAASAPVAGGPTTFLVDDIMYAGDPDTTWNHAFCNEDWTGCRWTRATEDNVDCAMVVPVDGAGSNYMDYNYYQWNYTEYNPSLDASQYKYVKVRYKFNDTVADGTSGMMWFSKDVTPLGDSSILKTATVTFDMSFATNTWQTVTAYLGDAVFDDGSKWGDDSIRQFRWFPFGNQTAAQGNVCYIEYIAFFKTQQEADAFIGPYETALLNAETETAAPADTAAAAPAAADTAAADTAAVTAAQTSDAAVACVTAAVFAIVCLSAYEFGKKRS